MLNEKVPSLFLRLLNIICCVSIVESLLTNQNGSKKFADDFCTNKESTCKTDVFKSMFLGDGLIEWKTPDFIRASQFPCEAHTVVGADGYILTLFRIPHGPGQGPDPKRIPVFLMHGILSSSVQWFLMPPYKSLAFMLVNAGYDVWLGNARGTTYSQKHVRLSPDDMEYWNFSGEEFGIYDIPAIITHILSQSPGHKNLYYIGHSYGNNQFVTAANVHSWINDKIRMQFSLSPTFYLGNMTNFVGVLAEPSYYAFPVWNAFGKGRFVPEILVRFINTMGRKSCEISAFNCGVCGNVWFAIWGFDPCQTDYQYLPTILAHLPDFISAKTVIELFQHHVTGKLQRFDYGPEENLRQYGSRVAPVYSLSKVTSPMVLYHALNDNLLNTLDFQRVVKDVVNLHGVVIVPYAKFQHIDFIFGIDAPKWIFEDIISRMKKFESATS